MRGGLKGTGMIVEAGLHWRGLHMGGWGLVDHAAGASKLCQYLESVELKKINGKLNGTPALRLIFQVTVSHWEMINLCSSRREMRWSKMEKPSGKQFPSSKRSSRLINYELEGGNYQRKQHIMTSEHDSLLL